MKTYLKDLTPEEIIKRLKNGEIIKFDDNDTFHIKMIDGIICRITDGFIEVFDTVETFDTYEEIKSYMLEMDILKKDVFNKIGG